MMQPLLVELGTEELPVKALPGLAQALFDGIVDGLVKRGIAVRARRRQAAVFAAPAGRAAARRGPRTARTGLRSARPLPQHRARRRRPADPGAAGVRAEGRRRVDAAGAHHRQQGRALRPSRGAAGRGDRRRCCRRSCAKRSPRCRSPSRCAGAPTNTRSRARCTGWCCCSASRSSRRSCSACAPDATAAAIASCTTSRCGSARPAITSMRCAAPTCWSIPTSVANASCAKSNTRRRRPAASPASTPTTSNRSTAWSNGRSAVACSFERDFLVVPQEALVATMETNQKFFPVLDAEGRLIEHFIGIANIESQRRRRSAQGLRTRDPPALRRREVLLRRGPEAGPGVDERGPGERHLPGEARQRSPTRSRASRRWPRRSPRRSASTRHSRARAAELSKADLQSRLVNEFPELQGIAGRYYAAAAGEPAGSRRRRSTKPTCRASLATRSRRRRSGQVLAIAERLDTLAGGFAAGLKPTGNKDPFALRRNALGLARTVIEAGIDARPDAALVERAR